MPNNVVLPAPFGPIMPSASPSASARSIAVGNHNRPKPLGDFVERKDGRKNDTGRGVDIHSGHALEVLLTAPHPALVNLDAETRPIRHHDMAVLDAKRVRRRHLRQEPDWSRSAPGKSRALTAAMCCRRGGSDAQLAGLAGNVDAHAEPVAEAAGLEQKRAARRA